MSGSTDTPHRPSGERLRPRLSLRAKALLYVLVPTVLILGTLAAVLPRANERAAEVLAGERNGEIGRLLAEQLSREIIRHVGLLDQVAARPEIYQFEPAAQQLALRTFVGTLQPFDAGVLTLDVEGRVTATDARRPAEVGEDWSGREFVRQALANPGPALASDIFTLSDGREVVALTLPVWVPQAGYRGFMVGLFSVAADAPGGLNASLARLPLGAGRRLIVVDSSRRALYHYAPGRTGQALTGYPEPAAEPRAVRLRTDSGGEEQLVAVAAVPDTGWSLVLEEPWSRLAATYEGATRLLFALLLLGLLAPALAVALGVGRVTRPIADLTRAVEEAASGELGQQVTVHTGDELEILAEQFNDMSTRLAASYADLEQRVEERTRELNALYEQARETATLAERNRLARELHDSVTQTLFSAKLVADVLPRLWQRDPDLAAARLEDLRALTGGALAEMRALLVELRPAALAEGDMSELLHNLAGAAQVRGRLPVHVQAEKAERLPPEVQEVIYRIAQEALNNILKHAQATEARIAYAAARAPDGLQARLEVSDDGVGFDAEAGTAPGHFGLGIMRERAGAVGAGLRLESAPQQGTRVTLTWRERQPPL